MRAPEEWFTMRASPANPGAVKTWCLLDKASPNKNEAAS